MLSVEKIKSDLKALNAEYAKIKDLPPEKRGEFGRELNKKRAELEKALQAALDAEQDAEVEPLDETAPSAPNRAIPRFNLGSKHPLMTELNRVLSIYSHMGFDIMEARQLDDEFHMFDSLNFPAGHPARDGYDTFRTAENFIPPAHTSTMQYRALTRYKDELKNGGKIAVVIPGRVFRNEDADATHEHTFYQCEGVFVSEDATMGQMLGVLKTLFETYYGQKLNTKTQPGFFPFTEPSLEFLIEKPKSLGGKGDGWLEMLGCGMIHPNVLETAGIDPEKYKGFAWGGGIDRLVMLKYGLTDIRYFESGKLEFLEEF
ncbi:phenylalanine--tRNA ligase subunit alpha [Candidatus Saccharibacteria bacterium]|nr:phenylalanine--tRNA ligase subunit alpha [Candidatus Saccharibacteria bacterium]MBQ9017155.1 phenylalanine--tRNA ligase subunit alpha [Candidatus Saccharibacteria bacterium]